MTKISNFDDVIDSRDIIARIEELQEERSSYLEEFSEDERETRAEHWNECTPEGDELAALEALAEEGEQYAADWEYGETLIRYSYLTEYVQQLLEDCGVIPKNIPHYVEIDWEATARNVKADYTEIDFDGVAYFIR